MARKDLDRIRAEDSSYPGLTEALRTLGLENIEASPIDPPDGAIQPTLETTKVPAAAQGVPADWYPDRARRHSHRYWDGTRWTEHVSNNGQPTVDPLGAPAPPPIG